LDIIGTYLVEARANNSARSFCLNIADVCTVDFSFETLMKVYENGLIVTAPLAGTRYRSQRLTEDNRLSSEHWRTIANKLR
jgi:salicylate synthetase